MSTGSFMAIGGSNKEWVPGMGRRNHFVEIPTSNLHIQKTPKYISVRSTRRSRDSTSSGEVPPVGQKNQCKFQDYDRLGA
jgi:hypothetical protein